MMNTNTKRWIAGAVLAALVATLSAPAAEAANRRYKNPKVQKSHSIVTYAPPRVHRVVRHVHVHDDGAAFVGFVGGLVLGAVLSQSAPPPHYVYVDPYCDARFESLEAARAHFRYHRHPYVVRVIEANSGHCVDGYRYNDGVWRHWDVADWDD